MATRSVWLGLGHCSPNAERVNVHRDAERYDSGPRAPTCGAKHASDTAACRHAEHR